VGLRERLVSSSKKHESRVVLALDLTGPESTRLERAANLLNDVSGMVAAVKVNFQLLLPRGLDGLSGVGAICAEGGLPLIADIKLNDIESTNLDAVEQLYRAGFDAVIANPFVGFDGGLSRVIHRAHEMDKGVFVLVYMSHAGAKEGYGLKVGGEPLYLEFARRARDWEADGAIVSAKALSVISQVRKILGKETLILSPGVGMQGGEGGKAVKAGSDFAIVGRSIVEAEDPVDALQAFNRSLPSP
jgi:orotidine-5'-phosphate decarboxylase